MKPHIYKECRHINICIRIHKRVELEFKDIGDDHEPT